MSAVAVDSSVLLAIFKNEPEGAAWVDSLDAASASGVLLVSTVVLAEIRAFFPSDAECRNTLRRFDFQHSAISEDAALLAGQIYQSYRHAGGPRKVILPDFLIAAHAARQARLFATLDRGYLRHYFPALRLLQP